jgi:RNA recognition motif-containing protein
VAFVIRLPEESVIMAVKLFVGGLAFATSSDRLRETFAAVGTVASASVVKDPAGQSRGFGFVEMETTEEATDAISRLHGSQLDGRSLRVELSQKQGSNGGGRR